MTLRDVLFLTSFADLTARRIEADMCTTFRQLLQHRQQVAAHGPDLLRAGMRDRAKG